MVYSRPNGPASRGAVIFKGAAVGFLIGLASIFGTTDKKSFAILRAVSLPVQWVTSAAQKLFGWTDGSTALIGWLGMGIWCAILGGLIAWSASALYSKITGGD